MLTVKGTPSIGDVKRCYILGAVAKLKCPDCGEEIEHDFGDQYLSHPEVGDDDDLCFYCDGCDKEWEAPMKVTSAVVTIEIDDEKIEGA